MTIDTKQLRKLAEAATPGPWWIDSHGSTMVNPETLDTVFITSDRMGPSVRHEDTGNLSRWRNDNDASFIAAANPTAILELLDLLDTRNRRIDELLAERNATGVAIDRALAGHVPDEHPLRSRLLMLANSYNFV